MGKKIIKNNKICWVGLCGEVIKEWPYCEKHHRMMMKGHKLEVKVPTSPKSVGKPGA